MEQQMYKVQIDGEERSFPAGTTYLQIAGEYQERYPHDIVLVYVNGKLQELPVHKSLSDVLSKAHHKNHIIMSALKSRPSLITCAII